MEANVAIVCCSLLRDPTTRVWAVVAWCDGREQRHPLKKSTFSSTLQW